MSKRNPWFRVYTRIVDDDKLLLIDKALRWDFMSMLALTNDGLLDEPPSERRTRKIAVRLRMTPVEVTTMLQALHEAELVDADGRPCSWDSCQYRSDHDITAAERSRRYRAKKKKGGS